MPAATDEDERELATEGWYSWGLRGAGGILGTVEDLWRFEQALRGDALLTKDSKKKLFTPALNSFAYGWYVQKSLRKTTSLERWGTTASGFTARCARFPDEDASCCSRAPPDRCRSATSPGQARNPNAPRRRGGRGASRRRKNRPPDRRPSES